MALLVTGGKYDVFLSLQLGGLPGGRGGTCWIKMCEIVVVVVVFVFVVFVVVVVLSYLRGRAGYYHV